MINPAFMWQTWLSVLMYKHQHWESTEKKEETFGFDTEEICDIPVAVDIVRT